MTNIEYAKILQQGVSVWNKWRQENPSIEIDLSGEDFSELNLSKVDFSEANLQFTNFTMADLRQANLRQANLRQANLRQANLREATLREAYISEADLSEADLSGADLNMAYLSEANLSRARLTAADFYKADLSMVYLNEADLSKVNLKEANLSGASLNRASLIMADLSDANLSSASLIQTNLESAILTGCNIYEISASGLILENAKQNNLIITPPGDSAITVDRFEVAQFVYLLIHSEGIRQIVDTITSEIILILGRFTPERKPVFEALRERLRSRSYLPVFVDFQKPESRDLTDVIFTLARMSKFIIVDLTEANSFPLELQHVIPQLPSVPVQTLILNSRVRNSGDELALIYQIGRFPWVLEPYKYENQSELLESIDEKIIVPAERRAKSLKNIYGIAKVSSFEMLPYFISYSWEDKDYAIKLYNDLIAAGVRCRLLERDERDVRIGRSWVEEINRTIKAHGKVLLILSRNSLDNPWIANLIIDARNFETSKGTTVLFPVFLFPLKSEDTAFSNILTFKNVFDFSQWKDGRQYQKAFSDLVMELTLQAAIESGRSG